jgi:hypothetical protein
MSNADVSRAANSAVDAASAGFQKYFETMQERVISLLAEDRDYLTKSLDSVNTILAAVAHEQQEIRAEGKRDRGELLAGVQGLAQDVSVVVASVQRHEAEIAALKDVQADLARRFSKIEQFDRDALSVRIDRLESIIADFPTRQHDPDAQADAAPERPGRRGSTRGAGGKGDTGE